MSGYHERTHNGFEPFPVHTLKRVDRPTIHIDDDKVKRTDERGQGFCRARRGDFGPRIEKEVLRFVPKQPNLAALVKMTEHMKDMVDGRVGKEKAPIPQDHAVLTRYT